MNRLFSALVISWLLAAPVAADFEKGVAAYDAGDFDTALQEFEALAEKDIVVAQTNVGYMYTLGEGTEVNLETAYYWFRRAAENKSSAAQVTIASMLYHGEGTAADAVESYAWFSVAAASGQDSAGDFLLLLTSRLSSEELDRARVLSERYYEQFALPSSISLGQPGS